MQDIFADAIGNITVFGGTVRLEFLKVTSLDETTNQPKYEVSHRLVMPTAGFMQAAERHAVLRQKLIDGGHLSPPAATVTQPTAQTKTAEKSASKTRK
jgi:hypothetical protein